MSWFDMVTRGATPLDRLDTSTRSHRAPGADVIGRRRLPIEVAQIGATIGDVVVAWASAIVSHALWFREAPFSIDLFGGTSTIGLASGLSFAVLVGLRGGYSFSGPSSPRRQSRMVVENWLLGFAVLGWGAFLGRIVGDASRGSVLLHFAVGLLALLCFHLAGARLFAHGFAAGNLAVRRVALVVATAATDVDRLRRRLILGGVDVASCTVVPPWTDDASLAGACLEAVGEVRAALARVGLDGVYVFAPWYDRGFVERFQTTLGPMPVPLLLFADHDTNALIARPEIRIGDLRGFEVQHAPLSRVDRMLKRLLDVAVAGTALILLSPLMALVALAILAESGRPVLFRQTRRGRGARPFSILKFRSMTVQENGDRITQATRDDVRVTALGRILRRTSVDELPQLINVLRGEMSIVGPRPHAVAHDDFYDGLISTYTLRQHVKPGITGWAQMNGFRGETSDLGRMASRVEYDLWYIDNWSIWLDVKIIFMTMFKIFGDERAY
jgi:Undecaprenyl-phosphate glucose phosphotransferase